MKLWQIIVGVVVVILAGLATGYGVFTLTNHDPATRAWVIHPSDGGGDAKQP